ncbi:hypothetical protein CTAYLR_008018 [Chrysophaeum taylorii]|uniref:Uncharacterized protein n=1 Tax=Chrysophaeum taylorii TaxID=2483200 RepID=A0AAD7XHD7_9STRA|nr:hypothetical protein CTAYLR_008018 [Chrysophaeum taylorii]
MSGLRSDEENQGLVTEVKKQQPEQPRYGPMAYASLALLAVQNCSAVLIMRWTRATPGQNDYNTQTAVVMQEVLKTAVSLVLVLWERGEISSTFRNVPELLKTSVPALLYLVQNNLQYVAISNLNAATYQVTYQLKILSTALLSVCLLGRQLSRRKWAALVVLTVGVAAVQLSELGDHHKTAGGGNGILGLSATILATLSSGCAGVYFEKILKSRSDLTLWQRNVQLGLYSILIGLSALAPQRAVIRDAGFFAGYTRLTVVNLAVQSLGGLIIAVVIKYADNILKNFATSLSIIGSVVFSALFLGQSLSWLFLLGVACVNYAIALYASGG